MELSFDTGKNLAVIKLSGRLSREIILEAFDRAVADPRYREGMGRVWDFREADLSDLNADTVVEMAQYAKRFPPGINDVKVAFVTERDLEFGLSRMFEMTSKSPTPIGVFRSMNDARDWMEK